MMNALRSRVRSHSRGRFRRCQRSVQGLCACDGTQERHRRHRALHGRFCLQFRFHGGQQRQIHLYNASPAFILLDTEILAQAPERMLWGGAWRYGGEVLLRLRMAHCQYRHWRVLLRGSRRYDARVASEDHGRCAAADASRSRRRAAHRRRAGDGGVGHGLRAGFAPCLRVGTLFFPCLGNAGAGARRALRSAWHPGGRGHDADVPGAFLAQAGQAGPRPR